MPPDRARNADVLDLTITQKHHSLTNHLIHTKKRKEKENRPTVTHTTEVIEISSDEDEEPVPPPPRTPKKGAPPTPNERARLLLTALEKKFRALEQEKKQLEAQVNCLRQENAEFRAKGTVHLNNDDVDEHILCEVCSLTMWTPYVLTCGHAFCGSCLESWFDRALRDWASRYPQFPPHVLQAAHIARYGIPPPQYLCPKCRTAVSSKPTQDFTLKGLVGTIAKAKGEAKPGAKETSFRKYFDS
ncbi:hypothetical protein K435DRAFT_965376 [Dendrothele bispora CBS 962.96]|uniref:RING-type domain-containing protein n=1 Tax=Dendrothele bispora (strain CBS 962.96) TaxID=1314807 RepID=A0A4S8M5Y2_DENBC|nr:hypothetical protein K435DRAFT_965376 [Dendrothele bispora CBS 962.96]